MSSKPPKMDDLSFILVWGYLMIVSIALAPLVAFAIKSALS